MVEAGKRVAIEFAIELEDGTPIDDNYGQNPFEFEQGQQEILATLEQEINGLNIGDKKTVTLSPEQAYGQVNTKAYQQVDIEMIPKALRTVGAYVLADDHNNQSFEVRIHALNKTHAILDFNHPLAGKELIYHIKIIDIY